MPAGESAPAELVEVGRFSRFEAATIPVAYQFDLRTNMLSTIDEPNPSAGMEHTFAAYRVNRDEGPKVTLTTT